MPTSKIIVYSNNKPSKNIKVSLEFTGFTNLGFTSAVYTNSDGVAYIEHSSTGTANIYLNGSKKGSISTPGEEVVYL